MFSSLPHIFTAALGEDVRIIPREGEARTIRGVFRAPYQGFAVGGEVEVAGQGFRCDCASADVAGVKHGDTLERAGVNYRITGIEPDGQGMTGMKLEEA